MARTWEPETTRTKGTMKLELFFMFLCLLLASFIVFADETDSGHKDDDQVIQAEDPRWGRRKNRKHKVSGKRDFPWEKKNSLEDQQYFDWPWNKRKATDINQDEKLWTKGSSDVTKEDEEFWPWSSSDVTREEGENMEDDPVKLVS